MRFITVAVVFQAIVQLVRVSGVNPIVTGPLVTAASRGDINAVSLLIQRGADVNEGVRGWTALHEAARRGHLEVVDLLLEAARDRFLPLEAARDRFLPIMIAARHGHFDIFRRLYEHSDHSRDTLEKVLLFAAYNGHADVVRYLLERDPTLMNSNNSGRYSVTELSSNNDPWDHVFEGYWSSPIQMAFFRGHSDVVMTFVEHGAGPSIDILCLACHSGLTEVVNFLIDNGADVNAQTSWTTEPYPLNCALETRRFEMAEGLIQRGAFRGLYEAHVFSMKSDERMREFLMPKLMAPITAIRSAVSTTDSIQAFEAVYPTVQAIGFSYEQGLIAFAFESLRGGVDLFKNVQFHDNLINVWSEERVKMIASIISKLVYFGCSDLSVFYSISNFIANEDDDMLRHTETALKYLAGSHTESPQATPEERENYRTVNGAILNEMIEFSKHLGFRPVVKALFAMYHQDWKTMRTLGVKLAKGPVDLVISYENGPFNSKFRAKVMRKLKEATRRIGRGLFLFE